jgi:hypothetical protein
LKNNLNQVEQLKGISSIMSLMFRSIPQQISRRALAQSSQRRGGGGGAQESQRRFFSSDKMTQAERDQAIQDANDAMKSYVETRLLAKQGKLKSKRKQSETSKSETSIQLSLLGALAIAFVASPFLGKKIATDKEFREAYVPSWFDFRVRSPESAWTRQELHDQVVKVEREMRERAIRGDFAPEKLAAMKSGLAPRSDLSNEDIAMAEKFGWSRIHPGVDPDDDDDDDDDDDE